MELQYTTGIVSQQGDNLILPNNNLSISFLQLQNETNQAITVQLKFGNSIVYRVTLDNQTRIVSIPLIERWTTNNSVFINLSQSKAVSYSIAYFL